MWLLILTLVIIGFLAFSISQFAKFLLRRNEKWEKKVQQDENPYIKFQKFKSKNDENYEAYLKWMEKEGDGVPVDKFVTPEDAKAEKKIKKLL